VLVLVGLAMFQLVGTLDFRTIEDSLPAFVTIVLIPLTLSITQGILWGFILHAVLYLITGRRRELNPTLWLLAATSVGLLWIESR
jgi:AGZA family xanthine/uracil permease-like MFS transporter